MMIFKRSISIIKNLVEQCTSCGINLQSTNSKLPGFLPLVDHKPFEKYEDKIFNNHVSHLSDEDKKLLNYDSALDGSQFYKKTRVNHYNHNHNHEEGKECLRCRDIKYRSKYSQESTIQPIFEELKNKPLIYVTSALEFPLNLDKKFLTRDPIVVINKLDLITLKFDNFNNFPFFKTYLNKNYGVNKDKIFFTSCTKMYGIKKLYEYLINNDNLLDKDYQLIGDINSGKSSLISSLLYYQKNDFRISPKTWKLNNGPGISDFPGYTRGNLNFNLKNFELNDAPGFNQFNLPDFKKFKNIFKNIPIYKKGLYNDKYTGLKGPQVLSFAGIFYIKFPQGIYQYKNLINITPIKVRSIEKLGEWMQDIKTNNSLAKQHIISPTNELKKFYIPPFYGKIDLVVKNFGYIEITPTGGKSSNELIEIYLPKDIDLDMIIRKPLVKYVFKSLSGKDKYGNLLKRENFHKSTKVINDYDGKVFYSKLIPDLGDQFESISKITGKLYDDGIKIGKDSTEYWIQ